MTKELKSKIEANEWYTMQDLVKGRVFPWATSFWAVRNLVALDSRKKKVLAPVVTGTGRGTKYHFKGSNIIKFVKLIEDGKVRL